MKLAEALMRSWRRTLASAVALAIVAAAASTAPAAPADAQSPKITAKVGMYDCTSSSALCTKAVTTAHVGNGVRMLCWEEGRSAAGQKKWFYVKLSNGREGFVPAPNVWPQTRVASCRDAKATDSQGVIAAQWALGRNGQVDVPKTERDRLSAVWGLSPNHTVGDWSGDCIGFAALAWYSAGKKISLKDARVVFDQYNAAKRIKKDLNPPRGALVFWNAVSGGRNYGHVEISLGNGRSIGTQGWDTQRKPVSIEAIGSGNYLGWAMP